MPRGGGKGGFARGTPAEQFCTRERASRPKRGTPVVIIRGPSECFWPRWGSLKFRRHDLEKRSGGSPVIVFHHRRPPAPLPRISLSLSPLPSRLFLRCISGVEPTREHQFFSAPSDVCLFHSPPPLPPSSSRSFASVGFPRSWLCHLVPDGRSFPFSPSSFNPGWSLGSSIMVLSAPLGPAHAENGYPSFLRAYHLLTVPTEKLTLPLQIWL